MPRYNIVFPCILRELDHGRLCSLANILYWIVETFPCKLGLPNYLAAIYALHTLQSWTKRVGILHFRTHRTPIPRIWYHHGPSPRPTLVKFVYSGSSRASTMLFFFFRGRGYWVAVVASAFKLYLETRRSIVHFSQHFFQDCRCVSTGPVIQIFWLRF